MLMKEASPGPFPSPSGSSEGPSFTRLSSGGGSGRFSEGRGKLGQAEAHEGTDGAVMGTGSRGGGSPVQQEVESGQVGCQLRPYLVLTVDLGPGVDQDLEDP